MADWLGLIAVGIWGILLGGNVYAFYAIRKIVQQQKHWERKNKRHKHE